MKKIILLTFISFLLIGCETKELDSFRIVKTEYHINYNVTKKVEVKYSLTSEFVEKNTTKEIVTSKYQNHTNNYYNVEYTDRETGDIIKFVETTIVYEIYDL